MTLSWRIATVRGIAIRVHATFLLVVLLGSAEWGMSHGAQGAMFGALLVCCLFVCVALHELGHSLVAQRLGVSVREIMLLPIGGIARLGREPKTALHELLIAVAGPAVNVLIAAALGALSLLLLGPAWFVRGAFTHSLVAPPSGLTLLGSLIFANVLLALFNMIPALPMDGGRVFRAILTFFVGKLRATTVAALVGQVLAAGLAALGMLSGNLVLILIGMFVFFGAAQERNLSRVMAALADLSAGDAVDPRAVVLEPGDLLGVAVEYALRTPQAHFAVVLGDRVVGTLSREKILALARRHGPFLYVSGVMDRGVCEVDAGESLSEVRARLIERNGAPFVVRGPSGVLGLIGLEDVARAAGMADLLRHLGGRAWPKRA